MSAQRGGALLVAALLTLGGCASAPPSVKRETVVFGTNAAITVVGLPAKKSAAAIDAAFAMLGDMHSRFYPWRDGELRRLNARIAAGRLPVEVSDSMRRMLTAAKIYSAKSGGLFDPAVGGLTELWGFHLQTPPTRPPSAAALRQWRQNVPSMADLHLDGNKVLAAPPAMLLDFGALAKGVALDRVRRILADYGVTDALINIGGGALAMGKNGGHAWRVALFAGGRRAPLGVVELRDGEALSASGGGERFFVYDGKTYHHILDPRSGEPAMLRTAFVISDAAQAPGAQADALSTALVIAADADAVAAAFGVTMVWRFSEDGENNGAPSAAFAERLRQPGRGEN